MIALWEFLMITRVFKHYAGSDSSEESQEGGTGIQMATWRRCWWTKNSSGEW